MLRVQVCFTPAEVRAGDLEGATAAVIDVVRATSCIVEALANGAAAILPAVSVEEAVGLRTSLGDDALLCGERHGLRIEGFDLGNSPGEFTAEAVAGRRLVMTTTNGTKALAAAEGAERIVAASFLNLGAVARELAGAAAAVIVCAGREGRFAMDDVVCAGHIVRRILADGARRVVPDESAVAAADLAGIHGVSGEMLERTAAGRALVDVGLGGDLALCARADRHKIVPMMRERTITVASR